mmetsp:Transcript_90495/g.158158  ORF Transcript_90495/g.158158 Transcript_90495/m.158158 type:complete len:774 (+) Transcript_90495:67-2388(+)
MPNFRPQRRKDASHGTSSAASVPRASVPSSSLGISELSTSKSPAEKGFSMDFWGQTLDNAAGSYAKSINNHLTRDTPRTSRTSTTMFSPPESRGEDTDDTFNYDKEIDMINLESMHWDMEARMRPWLGQDGSSLKPGWSPLRIQVGKVVFSQQLEWTMGAVIIFNLVMIILETDQEAECYPKYYNALNECPSSSQNNYMFGWVNLALLMLYTIEATMRIFVERWQFFHKGWNLLDFGIVVLGWLSELLGAVVTVESVGWLRILRIGRLFRAMRIFVSIKELNMLLTGLVGSMKAIFFGSLMLLGMLMLFSILMVQYVHPINSRLLYDGCDRCSQGYKSVMQSTLTLFQQIVAGDSWGLISVPVIMKEPLTAIPLCVTLLTVGLGAMNLILAVIVDRAAEARESKGDMLIAHKIRLQRQRRLDLLEMFQAMDKDSSGTLTLSELEEAWTEPKSPFREMLSLMEIHRGDLQEMFESIDVSNRGKINYVEFCSNLDMMQSRDVRFLSILTKLRVHQVQRNVAGNRKLLKRHERLLENVIDLVHAIDAKISRLTGEQCESRLPATIKEPTLSQASSASVGDGQDLALLQKQIIDLDDLHRGVLRRAQEQAALMLQHKEFVDSLTEAVADHSNGEVASQLAESVQDQLSELLDAMQERQRLVIEEIDDKLKDEADMLASNATLLDSIGMKLGLEKRRWLSPEAEEVGSRSTGPFGPRPKASPKHCRSNLKEVDEEAEVRWTSESSEAGNGNDFGLADKDLNNNLGIVRGEEAEEHVMV